MGRLLDLENQYATNPAGYATPQTPAAINAGGRLMQAARAQVTIPAQPSPAPQPAQLTPAQRTMAGQFQQNQAPQDVGSPLNLIQRAKLSFGDAEGKKAYLQKLGYQVLTDPQGGLQIAKDNKVYPVDEASFNLIKDTADLVGGALPFAGQLIGAAIGGSAGAATTGVGAVPGGIAGGAAGGAIGETAREGIGKLLGVREDFEGKEIGKQTALGGLFAIGGEAGGALLSRVAPKFAAKQLIGKAGEKTTGFIAKEAVGGAIGGGAAGGAEAAIEGGGAGDIARGTAFGAGAGALFNPLVGLGLRRFGIGVPRGDGTELPPPGGPDGGTPPPPPGSPPRVAQGAMTPYQAAVVEASKFRERSPGEFIEHLEGIYSRGRERGVQSLTPEEMPVFRWYEENRPAAAMALRFGRVNPETGEFIVTAGREAELSALRDRITRRLEGERYLSMSGKGKELLLKKLAAEEAAAGSAITSAEDIAGLVATDKTKGALAEDVAGIARKISVEDLEGGVATEVPIRKEAPAVEGKVAAAAEPKPVATHLIDNYGSKEEYFPTDYRNIFIEKLTDDTTTKPNYALIRVNPDGTVETLASKTGNKVDFFSAGSYEEAAKFARDLDAAEQGGINVHPRAIDRGVKTKILRGLMEETPAGPGIRRTPSGVGEEEIKFAVERTADDDAYELISPGHSKLLKALDKFVEEGTMWPEERLIFKELFRDTDPRFLEAIRKIKSETSLLDKLHAWGGFDTQTKDVMLRKGLARGAARGTQSFDSLMHEFGHAAYDLVLNDADRKIFSEVFESVPRGTLMDMFTQGLRTDLAGASHFIKNVNEFAAQTFADYVMQNRVPDERLRPLMKRLADRFFAILKKLVFREEPSQLARLTPVFDKMLSGNKDLQLVELTEKAGPKFRDKLQNLLRTLPGTTEKEHMQRFVELGTPAFGSHPAEVLFNMVNKLPAEVIDKSSPEALNALSPFERKIYDAFEDVKKMKVGPLFTTVDSAQLDSPEVARQIRSNNANYHLNTFSTAYNLGQIGAAGREAVGVLENARSITGKAKGAAQAQNQDLRELLRQANEGQLKIAQDLLEKNKAVNRAATKTAMETAEELAAQTDDELVKQIIRKQLEVTEPISAAQAGRPFGEKVAQKPFPFLPASRKEIDRLPLSEEEINDKIGDILENDKNIKPEWSEAQKHEYAVRKLLEEYEKSLPVGPGGVAGKDKEYLTADEWLEANDSWISRNAPIAGRIGALAPGYTVAGEESRPLLRVIADRLTNMKKAMLADIGKQELAGDIDRETRKQIESYLLGIVNGKDVGTGAIDRAFGIYRGPQQTHPAIEALNLMQLLKLSFSPFVNLGGGTLNNLLRSDIATFSRGYAGLLKDMITNPEEFKRALRFAMESGSLESGMYEGASKVSKGIKYYLKPFQWTEMFNRAASARIGALQAERYAREVVESGIESEGGKRALRGLEELLGKKVDPTSLKPHMENVGGIEMEALLPSEALKDAANKFTYATQFGYHAQALPHWASTPWGKIFFKFKTFAYQQIGMIFDTTVKELTQPGGDKVRGVRNLTLLLTVYPMTGATVDAFKRFLNGTADEDDRGLLDKYIDGAAGVGALGLIGDTLQNSFRSRSGLLEALAGPTVTTSLQAPYEVLGNALDVAQGDESLGEAATDIAKYGTRQLGGLGTMLRNRLGLNE